jgi:hypothetical protein
MLDSLDTLIAFVVTMLVVGLLITIAVQMTSTALNLRGLNLFKGLSQTYRVIVAAIRFAIAQKGEIGVISIIITAVFSTII